MRACENITRDDRARLVSSNRERFAHLLTHFLLFQQQIFFVLVCIHPGNPRVPPRVLMGQKPAGAKQQEKLLFNFSLVFLLGQPHLQVFITWYSSSTVGFPELY